MGRLRKLAFGHGMTRSLASIERVMHDRRDYDINRSSIYGKMLARWT